MLFCLLWRRKGALGNLGLQQKAPHQPEQKALWAGRLGNGVSLGPGPPHKHPEGPGPGLLDPGRPAGWTPCLYLPLGPPLPIWCRVCARVSLFTGASAAPLLGVGRVRKQVVSTHACYILGVHGAVGWDSVGGQCAHRNLAEECAKGRRVETACGGPGGGGKAPGGGSFMRGGAGRVHDWRIWSHLVPGDYSDHNTPGPSFLSTAP